MKIVIDLTSLSYHLSGIERFSMCLTQELLNLDKKNKYTLIFRNEVNLELQNYCKKDNVECVVLKGDKKLIFMQIVLYKELEKIDADYYLFFAFTCPLLFRKKHIINTIHDMCAFDVPQTIDIFHRLYLKICYYHAKKISEKIITVSNFSMERIQQILKIPKKNIIVLYNGLSKTFIKKDDIPCNSVDKYKLPKKYILSLSTLEPRKNLRILVDAFNNIKNFVDYDLVLIGRKGWMVDNLLKKIDDNNRIHFTGFVDDKYLPVIYKNSICFVFPSIYEGFGIPPVESLYMKVPVLSSNAPAMKEILQDEAIYFENNDIHDLENKLLKIDKIKLNNSLNEFQIKNYNYKNSAKKLLKILNKI